MENEGNNNGNPLSDSTDKKFTAQCKVCNRVFKGANCKAQLSGHMKTHEARDRSENKEDERKKRIPFGTLERRLRCPSDDGFHYRVFNDNWQKEPGRIKRAEQAGYEIVENYKPIPVGTNDDGSGIMGILMKIPQDIYEEDQASKQRELDKVDEQIKTGKFKEGAGDKRYSPDGIRIWSDDKQP